MKTAIVTGASSGIGLAVSVRLIEKGYRVFGLGRDFSRITSEIMSTPFFYPMVCDLTKTNELCGLIRGIRKSEDISVLVNNAGVGYFGLHEELNPKKIHEMVAVNLEAPLIITQMLLRDLKQQKGFVINISSVTATKTNPHGSAYGATKAGLSSFSASLFEEARKYGIKVVGIHPDMTKSNFYRNANFKEDQEADSFLQAEEVADAVMMALDQREGIVITEITLQPQKHRISRKEV